MFLEFLFTDLPAAPLSRTHMHEFIQAVYITSRQNGF